MKGRRFLAVLIGVLIFGSNSFAQVTQGQVKAESGGVAIGGDVRGSNIIIGVPAEQIDELVRERTKPLEDLSAFQKETIVLLKDKLDLNERQIRDALETVGEKNILPERLAAKLIDIAQNFNDLKAASTALGDDAEIEALRQQVQAAIDAGDLALADSVLAQIEMKQRVALEKQRAAFDRLASNAAATVERRGEVALARLHYLDAAKQFGEAARLLPQTYDFSKRRLEYLDQEALALYRQGDEFGDNAALVSAIDRYKTLLLLRPRERVPLDWAMTQMNLGTALWRLGERESGTAKLEEAAAAFRDALKERTRERVPLQWAMTQMNLGAALGVLGERESGAAKLEEAAAAYRDALKERTRERVPLDWAGTQNNLGTALRVLGERESGMGKLTEMVAAYREAMKEMTLQTDPTHYQLTMKNLNQVLTLQKRKVGKKVPCINVSARAMALSASKLGFAARAFVAGAQVKGAAAARAVLRGVVGAAAHIGSYTAVADTTLLKLRPPIRMAELRPPKSVPLVNPTAPLDDAADTAPRRAPLANPDGRTCTVLNSSMPLVSEILVNR